MHVGMQNFKANTVSSSVFQKGQRLIHIQQVETVLISKFSLH